MYVCMYVCIPLYPTNPPPDPAIQDTHPKEHSQNLRALAKIPDVRIQGLGKFSGQSQAACSLKGNVFRTAGDYCFKEVEFVTLDF